MPHTMRFAPFAPIAAAAAAAAVLSMPTLSAAQTIGSANVAAIEPPAIAHPPLAPCTVPLVSGAVFGASDANYTYTPPAACPGPWSKVVLAVDLSLDAGVQYDRTGTLWLGGVNLWFGTTAEPSGKVAPSWHVERDVTDDTALFESGNTGHMLVANYTNSADTSVITASAALVFYPATAAYPAPRTPDVIIPFANSAVGDTVALNTGTDTLSRTLTLPANIERAVFDATLQGQNDDEFWYTCVPASLATELESCSGGAFREGFLTIDGKPAGTAPVYPAIFTGGIDPDLWAPTPGVTTLDLKPFRMELTPFAGVLDAAGTHTLALSVADADNYFSVAGNLYLYLDKNAVSDTGTLLADTLAAASPVVATTQNTDAAGTLTATVDTSSAHGYAVAGRLETSHGAVTTRLVQNSNFSNKQDFSISSSVYTQNIVQNTLTTQIVATTDSTGTHTATHAYVYPLVVDTTETGTSSIDQTTKVTQGLVIAAFKSGQALPVSLLAEGIRTQDTVPFIYDPTTGTYSVGANTGMASQAAYGAAGSAGCVGRVLQASANVLTDFAQVADCPTASEVEAAIQTVLGTR